MERKGFGQLTQDQDTQGKPINGILQGEDVVFSNQQEYPDEDIGDNSRRSVVTSHSHGAVPEQLSESPRIWARNGGEVHQSRQTLMVGVEGRLTEEVDSDDDLGPSEVGADPKKDECNHKQVVQDIVAADIDGRSYDSSIL